MTEYEKRVMSLGWNVVLPKYGLKNEGSICRLNFVHTQLSQSRNNIPIKGSPKYRQSPPKQTSPIISYLSLHKLSSPFICSIRQRLIRKCKRPQSPPWETPSPRGTGGRLLPVCVSARSFWAGRGHATDRYCLENA